MPEITRILQSLERGDARAADELLPLVCEELRRLAAHKMSLQPPGQTLPATALVHEAYLRLVWLARPSPFGESCMPASIRRSPNPSTIWRWCFKTSANLR